MLRFVLLLGSAVIGLSGCGCFDEPGDTYSCSCERRCQGATATWTTSIGCTAQSGRALSLASNNCVNSCSPEASCSSCVCTPVSECIIEHTCR